MLKNILIWCAVAAVLAGIPCEVWAAATPPISGTITAVKSTDPGFVGAWKYCVTFSWDVTALGSHPGSLSHVSVLPGLDSCIYICRPGYFAFADTIGSTVSEESCTTYYRGTVACKGDPTLTSRSPAVKFEPYANPACGRGRTGTGQICFYSPVAPRPSATYPVGIWIKFGNQSASGPLVGQMPDCGNPSTAVEPTTWGAIKALMR